MEIETSRFAKCRILPHEIGDGPGNMALDEALLDSVADDPTHAVFRTYSWLVPTLSLGYFQTISQSFAEARWLGVPLVRRPTGGGALWHHDEVTYALIVPRSHPLARRSPDLYHAVHAVIADLLCTAGIEAKHRGNSVASTGAKPFLCFADRDPEDVVAGDVKVVGSAQRRRVGAVLQHGSLLLGRSAITPELPGVFELGVRQNDVETWSKRLSAAVPRALGLEAVVSQVSKVERARAHELEMSVYQNREWTEKR